MGTSSRISRSFVVRLHRLGRTLLLLGGMGLFSSNSWAQSPTSTTPLFPGLSDANSIPTALGSSSASTSIGRTPRLRLFCITPGFLADPLGMRDDDTLTPGIPSFSKDLLPQASQDNGPDWIQVGMGSDVPFFDLRRPGDPGGFGYYRVNTQVSLLDSARTACSLGLQAVTPTGAQFGGLPDGATVVIPAFSVFHAVTDRLALQGFVSKNVPISDASTAPLQRNLQYGLALQRPILADGPEGLRKLYFSLSALGQLTPERDTLRPVSNYDVLPGFQWHVNDSWWLSSAVLMPVGTVRTSPGQWQLTCSLQF